MKTYKEDQYKGHLLTSVRDDENWCIGIIKKDNKEYKSSFPFHPEIGTEDRKEKDKKFIIIKSHNDNFKNMKYVIDNNLINSFC